MVADQTRYMEKPFMTNEDATTVSFLCPTFVALYIDFRHSTCKLELRYCAEVVTWKIWEANQASQVFKNACADPDTPDANIATEDEVMTRHAGLQILPSL